MRQILENPNEGKKIMEKLSDPRWSDGWQKFAKSIDGIEIHWLKNPITGLFDDFKFKD